MKKKIFALLSLLALGAAAFAQSTAIAVPAPKTVNIGSGNEWIPLFIQGVITANFQQYSGMNVIDRQNNDMVKAEQRMSEGAEFDEKTAIELGKMTSARYIVTGSIMGKSASYALTFSITDAQSGETKASASVPNCLFSALENGTAANQISYDLMTGYGIKLDASAKAKLTQQASVMTAETTAQASVAKGIVAEQSGSNIEALTYYIQAKKNDKRLGEARSRMESMSTAVAGGNFGAQAKNLIKMRNDWDKLLREAAELIAANPPTFELAYYSDIKPGEIDYDKGTMYFSVSFPYLVQNNVAEFLENRTLAEEMKTALQKIPESRNWGEKINGFPWSYADDIGGDNWMQYSIHGKDVYYIHFVNDDEPYKFWFDVSLLNDKKKIIGTKTVCYYVNLAQAKDKPRSSHEHSNEYYDDYGYSLKEGGYELFPYLIGDHDGWVVNLRGWGGNGNTMYVEQPNTEGERIGFTVTADDADTNSMYISVKNTNDRNVAIVPLNSAADLAALQKRQDEEFRSVIAKERHNVKELTASEFVKQLKLYEMRNEDIQKIGDRVVINKDFFFGYDNVEEIVIVGDASRYGLSNIYIAADAYRYDLSNIYIAADAFDSLKALKSITVYENFYGTFWKAYCNKKAKKALKKAKVKIIFKG